MQVILLEKVSELGNLGERVTVKAGYARNYLIPTGKATPVTPANIALFEQRRGELEAAALRALTTAEERRGALSGLRVAVAAKVGEEGKLYGSVGAISIVQAVADAGITIHKREVRLPDGPLHAVGEYEVTLHLHSDVEATVVVEVVPE